MGIFLEKMHPQLDIMHRGAFLRLATFHAHSFCDHHEFYLSSSRKEQLADDSVDHVNTMFRYGNEILSSSCHHNQAEDAMRL